MSAVGSMKIFKGGLVPLVHKPVGELRENTKNCDFLCDGFQTDTPPLRYLLQRQSLCKSTRARKL
jgi:hypothetical protein